MVAWAVQDAKARFSEVIERARTEGPQEVRRHGKRVAMIVADADWIEEEKKREDKAFIAFLLSAPQKEGFEIDRIDIEPREVDFGFNDEPDA